MTPDRMAMQMVDADGYEDAMKSAVQQRDDPRYPESKKYWERVIKLLNKYKDC
jgi:hypothetical protein